MNVQLTKVPLIELTILLMLYRNSYLLGCNVLYAEVQCFLLFRKYPEWKEHTLGMAGLEVGSSSCCYFSGRDRYLWYDKHNHIITQRSPEPSV